VYVCHCQAVTDRTINAAIDSGARSVAEVTARCRAGNGCGGCHNVLQALVDATAPPPESAGASAA
jgi:bacterioferritin-associated ferredoxin